MIIHRVETGSLEWHKLHLGMPTGPGVANLITPKGKLADNETSRKYCYRLAAQLLYGKPSTGGLSGIDAIEVGQAREAESLKRYAYENDVTVRPMGFTTPDHGLWGATPDAGEYIGDTLIGVVEAKNPGDVTHLQYSDMDEYLDDAHRVQVQMEMLCTDAARATLLSSHPEAPQVIAQIGRDAEFLATLTTALSDCIVLRDQIIERQLAKGWTLAKGLHPDWVERWEREQEMLSGGWQGAA